jgi:Ca2+-binding RTX toxin-like protein
VTAAGRNAIALDNFNPITETSSLDPNARITVRLNTLRNSADYGVRLFDESVGTGNLFNNNSITGNGLGGFSNEDIESPVDARRNWWGSASGPSVWGIGTGQSVSASVDFFPWARNSGRTTFATCTATASGSTILQGGNASEILCGTSANNRIRGGGGNDLILGNGGNDTILDGQGGNDRIIGDQVGAAGNDSITGGSGTDFGDGRGGADTFSANTENTSDF